MTVVPSRRAFAAALGALPALLSARAFASELSGKLTITGSSTVAPLVLELGKSFEKLNPKVRIDVQTGGSSRGVNDVRQGLADIGMASRELTTAEKADLTGHIIARDGICLIVHTRNAAETLSDAQIRDIFTGKITDWRDLGGKQGRISVVNKAEGRSTLELFLAHYGLKNSDVKASVVIGDNAQGIKTISSNPGAIGYVSVGAAEFEIQQKTPLRMLSVGGIAPSSKAVRDGTFPLSRSLTLATRGTPSQLVQAFIAFAQSPVVDDIIREQFFVPVSH
jgi:phosphate transport system substrate-binding protein